jgi:hypothetical protein
MHKLTDDQIDFILDDIQAKGVDIEDLRYNLLDHICCIIESEMQDGDDFYVFYASILPRFYQHELKEIQAETEKLIRFKHYYAMKNTLKISGMLSAAFTLIGATLKTLHLPGASIAIILGGIFFCLVFLPLFMVLTFRDEENKTDKWVQTIGLLLALITSVGIIFKLQHWPYANILMRSGLTLFIFAYIPLYFFTRIRRPGMALHTSVNAALMMACGGMLYSLYNLGYSTNVRNSVFATHTFIENNYSQLRDANTVMEENISDTIPEDEFYDRSVILLTKITDIKMQIIAASEQISLEAAADFDVTQMKNYQDLEIVKTMFEQSSGPLGAKALMQEIQAFNNIVIEFYPDQPEKRIAVENLQLTGTTNAILIQQLTQIQLQIATSQNSYLNRMLSSR